VARSEPEVSEIAASESGDLQSGGVAIVTMIVIDSELAPATNAASQIHAEDHATEQERIDIARHSFAIDGVLRTRKSAPKGKLGEGPAKARPDANEIEPTGN
jgi:hypothetical protein